MTRQRGGPTRVRMLMEHRLKSSHHVMSDTVTTRKYLERRAYLPANFMTASVWLWTCSFS